MTIDYTTDEFGTHEARVDDHRIVIGASVTLYADRAVPCYVVVIDSRKAGTARTLEAAKRLAARKIGAAR